MGVCAQRTSDAGATVLQRHKERTSSWGIWRFLSLLLVRVSLVSKGSMFWLKES